MHISVRDVDPKVFRQFKVKTVESGLKTGAAVTTAMKDWSEKREKLKKETKSFFELKPWDWGKENKNLSLRIDEILYGAKE